jgi:hypothetical protein
LLRRTGVYILALDNPDDSQQQGGGGGGSAGTRDGGDSGGQQTERFVSVRHVEKKKQERPKRGGGQDGGSASGSGAGAGAEMYWDREGRIRWRIPRDTGSGSGGSDDYKHEGDVNTEMRCSKNRIEWRDSNDNVVGYYDKQNKRWCFIGEIKLGSEDADHPVYGVNGGVGMTTEPSGAGAVLVKAPKPGPPTSEDMEPLALERRIAALEQRVAELESRLNA